MNKFLEILLKSFFLFSAVTLFAGCATIIKGSDQTLNIKTDPSPARCIVSDLRNGNEVANVTTPGVVALQRGQGYFKKGLYKIACELEGYDKKENSIEGTINAWYLAGNILIGGLIGWFIVDPISGGMWNLEPENVSLLLQKKSEGKVPVEPSPPKKE